MRLINRTPHPIVVMDKENKIIARIEPEGDPIRLEEKLMGCDTIETDKGKFLICNKELKIGNLPEIKKDVIYIVSMPVAQSVKRSDLVSPDEYVRDKEGKIIGIRSFKRII